jgi:hypothetical protein
MDFAGKLNGCKPAKCISTPDAEAQELRPDACTGRFPPQARVLVDGKIVRTGGKELALELEARGYDWILKAAG